jgi:hypothetical protein
VVAKYDMEHRIDVVGRPLRTLVLATTAAHCVNDLLFRQRAGQLSIDIPLVLSNHSNLAGLAKFYGVPFESMSVTDAQSKVAFEARVLAAVDGRLLAARDRRDADHVTSAGPQRRSAGRAELDLREDRRHARDVPRIELNLRLCHVNLRARGAPDRSGAPLTVRVS